MTSTFQSFIFTQPLHIYAANGEAYCKGKYIKYIKFPLGALAHYFQNFPFVFKKPLEDNFSKIVIVNIKVIIFQIVLCIIHLIWFVMTCFVIIISD